MDNHNKNTIKRPRTHDPRFELRLDAVRQQYPNEYHDSTEVSVVKDIYGDLETCRVIGECILGSPSTADIVAIFTAMQDRLSHYL